MNHEEVLSLKVSYYSSYKEFNRSMLAFWPFLLSFTLLILSVLIAGDSIITRILGFLSLVVLFFCAVVTRFYANSFLIIDENGLTIKNKETKHFLWDEISKAEYLIPSHGLSYLEIILAIYTSDNNIEYLFINSVSFKTATTTAKEIANLISEHIDDHKFHLHKRNFMQEILLKKFGLPDIYANAKNQKPK